MSGGGTGVTLLVSTRYTRDVSGVGRAPAIRFGLLFASAPAFLSPGERPCSNCIKV
jgi:hypothetical protein